jgi:ATP-binding cassette, subfamily C, bacterial
MASVKIYKQLGAVIRLAGRAYRPYRKQIFLLVVLSSAGGLLEGIGINAVIPLLTFALGLQIPATDAISQFIKLFFDLAGVPFVPRYLLAFIVILFIGKAMLSLLFTYIQIRITNEYERVTRSKLFTIALSASWPYLLKQKLGNLETVLMIDTPASVAMLTKLSFTITIVTSLLMYLVVAFSISPFVMFTTVMIGALVFISLRPLMDRVHGISSTRTVAYRETLHHTSEHMSGLKSVKSFGVESAAIARGDGLFSQIKDLTSRLQIIQSVATQAVAPIGIIYIAGILALSFKTPFVSFAALPAIFYLIYRIFTYVQQLQNNVQYISELAPHLERVLAYEDGALGEREEQSGDSEFNFQKEITFKNVSFSYESGNSVLHDVSFSIPKGRMIGIVGPSGAGKTTCVDLLLRLLTPTNGSILVDGIDGKRIRLADWRKRIAYVSQDLFLLQDSIRNNIRFYDDSLTDAQVWEAAEMAHIADFIRSSPEGLDTQVGDRGIRLSAGQRQRIVIARALARKPEVLILDEATSSLDGESEAHIKKVIENLKGQIAIVAIAHRLSTIMGSDQLVVLQDGRVIETGSPQELLGNMNSYFYRVYTITQ